jgi:hypothetical protein
MIQIEKESRKSDTEISQSEEINFRFRKLKLVSKIVLNQISLSLIIFSIVYIISYFVEYDTGKTVRNFLHYFAISYSVSQIFLQIPNFIMKTLPDFVKLNKKYKNSQICLRPEGITHKNQEGEIFLAWADIASAHRGNGELI